MAEHIEYQGNFSGSQIDTLLAKIQSSQVFTTEEKTKLASLVNYDDTEVKEDISDIETSLNLHKSDKTNPHEVTKEQVGLGNVDNTSDVNKPISTATQTALNNKVDKVTGKDLSTNDFTNEYKSQIEKNTEGIGAVANSVAKNFFNIAVTPTHNNATATADALTGTVRVTSTGAYARSAFPITLPTGNYIFNTQISLPSGICRIQFNTAPDGSGSGIGTPAFNPTESGVYTANIQLAEQKSFYILLYNNPSADSDARTVVYANLMIRNAAIEDDTFAPYAPTNRELYEMILALQSGS